MKHKLMFNALLLSALFLAVAPTIPASERAALTASTSGAQQPRVSLSPLGLGFVYHCKPTILTKTVVLTNDGPGRLDISSIAITNNDFSQVHTCGSTLGAGHSCTITVTWVRLNALGSYGRLVITDNGVGSPQWVGLSGVFSCPK